MELDEICGAIEQGAAGQGLDRAVKLIDGKTKSKDQPGEPSMLESADEGPSASNMPPMMSAAGQKLASKTAPSGALDWRKTQIGRR